MADLRVVSTGKEFRRIDNGIALLLEEMFPTALERINTPENAITAPRHIPQLKLADKVAFNVGQHPTTGNCFIRATDGRSEMFYIGDAAQARLYTFWLLGKPHTAPPEIVEQYARLKNAPDPEWLAEQSRNARETQESKQRR